VLVELGVVEQRTKAVYEVLDGLDVVEVAKRYGVCRQTVHTWLKRYANEGFSALVDKCSKPGSCPHQMPAVVEARVVEMRRAHPDWGPRTILYWLGREGIDRCRGGALSTGRSFATGSSSRQSAGGRRRTTSAGSGLGRWSSGRWTSSAAST
jgi:hypothetical protein